jgi:CheY-like chemotaxis protein
MHEIHRAVEERTVNGWAAPTAPILIVDPDDDARALYRTSLQLNGCTVVEASDGRDALTKALMQPPALVLTEVRLPFLDGCALCDILRRDRATARVPILVVTADARPTTAERARTAGAGAVLVKPTTPEQLLAETGRLLDSREFAPIAAGATATVLSDAAPARQSGSRMSKSFARFMTTTPPAAPPQLVCPSCDQPLTYEHSHVGGVSARNAEQWDQYFCPAACGTFQYRHRTRKLRHIA